MTFGLEFEVDCCTNHRRLHGNTAFGAKYDGSVSGEGMEFVSPILQGNKGIKELKQFLKFTEDNNWNSDETCGMHMHIGFNQLIGNNKRQFS